MIGIAAAGEWYASYQRDGATGLIDLSAAVRAASRQPVRRIDRFIQLALIGSVRCVGDRKLPAATGIYLASGAGPLSSIAKVHEQMLAEGLLPKPAQFINTLANTAGFYTARNLGLDAQCLFVSRGYASFEAALELAGQEVGSGRLHAALVGSVEECTWPLAHHAERIHRPEAQSLAEGSIWVLLEPGGATCRLEHISTLAGTTTLKEWLLAQNPGGWYWCSATLDPAAAIVVQQVAQGQEWVSWPGPGGTSPLAAAVAAVRFINSGQEGVLLSINADREGWYQVCRYRLTNSA